MDMWPDCFTNTVALQGTCPDWSFDCATCRQGPSPEHAGLHFTAAEAFTRPVPDAPQASMDRGVLQVDIMTSALHAGWHPRAAAASLHIALIAFHIHPMLPAALGLLHAAQEGDAA